MMFSVEKKKKKPVESIILNRFFAFEKGFKNSDFSVKNEETNWKQLFYTKILRLKKNKFGGKYETSWKQKFWQNFYIWKKFWNIYIIFINGKSGNQMEANFFTEFSTSKKWYIFNENSRNQIVWKKGESKVSTLANERMLES